MNAIMRQLYDTWSLNHPEREEAYDLAWEKYDDLLDAFLNEDMPKTKLSDATAEIAAAIEQEAFEAGFRMAVNMMAEGR